MTEQLWAPWRMEFITGEREEGCIFCNRLNRSQDQDDLILHRGQQAFVILNRYPYSNGHLMVVPHIHTHELSQIDAETSAEITELLAKSQQALTEGLAAQGFNVGLNLGKAAGAGVEDHLHYHMVPRWVGDTNFMPIMSDTRVMPEALLETYQKIKAVW